MRWIGLILCAVLVLGAESAPAFAQASAWGSRWGEIKQLYYVEGEEATAIDRMEQELGNLGPTYTETIQTEMLTMLREYFSAVSEPDRFGRILFKMFRADNVSKLSAFFAGTGLESTARRVRDDWSRPASARIQLGQSQLSAGQSTTFRVTVLNANRQDVGTTGTSVVVAPEGAATIDNKTGRIAAVRSGPVSVRVIDGQGRVLGETSFSGPTPTASIDVSPATVEVGAEAQFTTRMLDSAGKEISGEGAVVRANPPDLVELNVAERRVVAKKAGTVTLSLVDRNGRTLASGDLKIMTPLSIIVSPGFAEIEFGSKQTVVIEGNRSFAEAGVSYALDPAGVVEARETIRDVSMVKLELTGKKAGTATLRVKSTTRASLAEATFRVGEPKPSAGEAKAVVPPAEKSIVWPAATTGAAVVFGGLAIASNSSANDKYDEYAAGEQSYDYYKSQADETAVWVGLTAAATVGAGYLWYKYLKDGGETSSLSDRRHLAFGTRGARFVVLTIRF